MCASHLSDLLTHQREQPDVEQHLPSRWRFLEIDHEHHSEQEEEGEVGHYVQVKFDLRRVVQAGQSGPLAQRLQVLQAGGVTVDKKITGVQDTTDYIFSWLAGYFSQMTFEALQKHFYVFSLVFS